VYLLGKEMANHFCLAEQCLDHYRTQIVAQLPSPCENWTILLPYSRMTKTLVPEQYAGIPEMVHQVEITVAT